jgi:hypothetical protein
MGTHHGRHGEGGRLYRYEHFRIKPMRVKAEAQKGTLSARLNKVTVDGNAIKSLPESPSFALTSLIGPHFVPSTRL